MQRGAQSENLQMMSSSSSSNHHHHREASYNFRMLSSSSNHHRTTTRRPIVKNTASPTPTPTPPPLATFQEQPQTTNEGPSAGQVGSPSCQLVSPPRTTTTTTIGSKKKRTTRQRCYPYFHRNHDKNISHDDTTTPKRSLFRFASFHALLSEYQNPKLIKATTTVRQNSKDGNTSCS
eukprot:scaffold12737_cov79-Cylindrotheca_fusiformis.AAC.2